MLPTAAGRVTCFCRRCPKPRLIENGNSQSGTVYEFLQLRVAGTSPAKLRAFAFVRIARTELLSPGRMLDEAQQRLL